MRSSFDCIINMSRQGANRSISRRASSSKAVGLNDTNPPIHDTTHQDQALTVPSVLLGENTPSPSKRTNKAHPGIQHHTDDSTAKHSMNLRQNKTEQDDKGQQNPKRSPELKMKLRHSSKLTDSMEWQSTPSPSLRRTKVRVSLPWFISLVFFVLALYPFP